MNMSPAKRITAKAPLYNVSLIMMKNGFCNTTVNSPNPTTRTATMSGNHATLFLSINPAMNAITVKTTNIPVARMKLTFSERIENTMMGPNSILKLRSAFLSIEVSIADIY